MDDHVGIVDQPARPPATRYDEVLARLRDHVVEESSDREGRISERELCEKFGTSRTPLREALKALASEGLVELLPNRGARIKILSPAEVEENFDFLGGLEALAGRLACDRMSDQDFLGIETLHREMYACFLRADHHGYFQRNQEIHAAIFACAGNAVLTASARTARNRLRRVRYTVNLGRRGGRWTDAVREHELILDALRRRAGRDLADALFEHMMRTKSAVLDGFEVN